MNRVREALPSIQATLPSKLDLRFLFDQSLFVRAAVDGVIKEAAIAACLTALMILLFLGSWRSTLIVAISIPLSILWTIMVMSVEGQTLNVMTLGGLALAVGILVDDAMVEIENIHRHPAQGKPIIHAILDGAQQIATPAFVSTLSICIVFGPVVFLTGAVQSLFTPLAMAVVVAMMASYLLSRTLILTLIRYLLHSEVQMYQHGNGDHGAAAHRLIWNMHHRFNRRIERFRGRYRNVLAWSLHHRAAVKGLAATFFAGSLVLVLLSGKIFFHLIIIMALPGALAGILWMLFATQTTLNVPAISRLLKIPPFMPGPTGICGGAGSVYIVLGVLYESYVHPLTILSTLPSAGVGAILALRICHTDLSVIALIGIILLIGIVKKNAIVMIDFALEAERTACPVGARDCGAHRHSRIRLFDARCPADQRAASHPRLRAVAEVMAQAALTCRMALIVAT